MLTGLGVSNAQGDPDEAAVQRPSIVAPDWRDRVERALAARRAALGGKGEGPLVAPTSWPVDLNS
jgi:hypothetical protein